MKHQASGHNHGPSGPLFASIIEFLPDPVFAIDRQGKVIAWNKAMTELTGVRAADMIGKGNHEYSIPFWGYRRPVLVDLVLNWDEHSAKSYNYVRQEGENLVAEVENPYFKFAPTLFWNSARKLYDSDGNCIGAIEVIRDVTQLKGKALRQSEARLRTLLDNLPFDCWATDAEGRYTVQNSVSKKRWGDQLGKTLHEADIPRDVKELWISDNKIAFTGKILTAEVEYTHKGQSGVYQKILAPIWADDKIIGTLGVDIDITERKTAEQKLQESEQRLAAIFARAAVGLCEISPEGKFKKVNAELCRILDRTSDQLLNMSVSDVTHPDDLNHSIAALKRIWDKGEPASLDKRYLRPDGTVVFANSALTRLDGKHGRPQAILAVTVDTTQQVRAKEVLEQRVAERTAELENRNKEFRDLAHKTIQTLENDRRNLSKELHDSIGGTLAAIMYQMEARVEQMGKPPETVGVPLEKIIEYLSDAITESRRITKQLRPSVLDDFGLTAAIEEYIGDFKTFHPEIKIMLQVGIPEEQISSDAKTVLYRVLQEALNNVGKYSKADSVEIRCRRYEDYIRLYIKDNGIGFNASEVFGPASVMEGYGLNSMRERVEICHGKFHIESAPGQGTTVIAQLPFECHGAEF